MKFLANIQVMPLNEILDPQGKAVEHGLNNLGFTELSRVRVGKHITLEVEAKSQEAAEQRIKEACEKLLANLIIETYFFTLSSI